MKTPVHAMLIMNWVFFFLYFCWAILVFAVGIHKTEIWEPGQCFMSLSNMVFFLRQFSEVSTVNQLIHFY
jgi:hypothetical protein